MPRYVGLCSSVRMDAQNRHRTQMAQSYVPAHMCNGQNKHFLCFGINLLTVQLESKQEFVLGHLFHINCFAMSIGFVLKSTDAV